LPSNRTEQEPALNRRPLIRTCAIALAAAGLAWCIKAGAIMATGDQPPLAFELGLLLFPVGVIGAYLTLDQPKRVARAGLVLAVVAMSGSLLAMLYPLVPGARISTGEDFVLPFSLFVLTGSAGGSLALLLIGIAIARTESRWTRWGRVPLIVALLPLAFVATSVVHFEMPIFLIGLSWLGLAYWLWRVAVDTPLTSAATPRTPHPST